MHGRLVRRGPVLQFRQQSVRDLRQRKLRQGRVSRGRVLEVRDRVGLPIVRREDVHRVHERADLREGRVRDRMHGRLVRRGPVLRSEDGWVRAVLLPGLRQGQVRGRHVHDVRRRDAVHDRQGVRGHEPDRGLPRLLGDERDHVHDVPTQCLSQRRSHHTVRRDLLVPDLRRQLAAHGFVCEVQFGVYLPRRQPRHAVRP